MTESAILVEVEVVDALDVVTTLRFADRAIRPFPPTDADRPNVVWDSRLEQAPMLRRALFEDLSNLTPGLGVGKMVLKNGDGALNAYQAHVWQTITAWRWTEGTDFADAVQLFSGPADQPRWSVSGDALGKVSVGFWDRRQELEKPIQANLYGGGNDGATVFYDGEADGLKGQPKPLAWGDLTTAHVPAPQVNGGVQAYQLHDGAIQGTEAVFDRGDAAGVADDGDYVGAAFDAAAPGAAEYATDVGRGLIKLNASPVGRVTFGFKGDAAGGYVETAGPILARMLAKAGVDGARIGASVAGLADASVIGVYDQAGASAAQLTAMVARGAAAVMLPDRSGVWQALAFGPPALVADFEISPDLVLRLSDEADAPLPVGEVRVGWGQVFATFNRNELAPAIQDTSEAERLASQHRWATAEDAALKARLPSTWRKLEIATALRAEADAQALADDLLVLFGLRDDGRPRRLWKAVLEASDAVLGRELGDTVRLEFPDLDVDEHCLLIAEELLRPREDLVTWTLWG